MGHWLHPCRGTCILTNLSRQSLILFRLHSTVRASQVKHIAHKVPISHNPQLLHHPVRSAANQLLLLAFKLLIELPYVARRCRCNDSRQTLKPVAFQKTSRGITSKSQAAGNQVKQNHASVPTSLRWANGQSLAKLLLSLLDLAGHHQMPAPKKVQCHQQGLWQLHWVKRVVLRCCANCGQNKCTLRYLSQTEVQPEEFAADY